MLVSADDGTLFVVRCSLFVVRCSLSFRHLIEMTVHNNMGGIAGPNYHYQILLQL